MILLNSVTILLLVRILFLFLEVTGNEIDGQSVMAGAALSHRTWSVFQTF